MTRKPIKTAFGMLQRVYHQLFSLESKHRSYFSTPHLMTIFITLIKLILKINITQDNIKKVYQQSAYCINEMLKLLICGLWCHLKPTVSSLWAQHAECTVFVYALTSITLILQGNYAMKPFHKCNGISWRHSLDVLYVHKLQDIHLQSYFA